jgi:hypothetical protein
MRRLLLALPFALLPLAVLAATPSEDEPPHEHGSLGTHEHGVARLDVALDGARLELELQSPAMNLVGFEHPPSTDEDKARIQAVRQLLDQPLVLFKLDPAAGCKVTEQALESPLFGDKAPEDDDDHEPAEAAGETHHHDHSEIHANYALTCAEPAALKTLDLAALFKTFPATRSVQVQLIAPNGQQGKALTAAHSALKF